MVIQMEKELTAAEVRALPVGTKVYVHGHDRYGYPWRMACEIVKKISGKGVQLCYRTYNGPERMDIRASRGRTFTMEVKDGAD